MRVRTNRIYPYPVLSEVTDNFKDNTFNSDVIFEYDSETAFITVKTELHDNKMITLLSEGKVGLYCHIECSVTKYRSTFEIPFGKINQFTIEIPLIYLNESFETMCMLMAKEEIVFVDDNLGDLYSENPVVYPKYSTIGYTDTDYFPFTKIMNDNGEIPGIIQIVEDKNAKEVSYDCTSTFINVYVPEDVHQSYYDLAGDFIRTKQILTNITVLTDVINEIKNGADYSTYGWFTVLEDKFQSLGYENGFDNEDLKNTESIILAQKSLGLPFEDSFKELVESKERGM